ncbi:unnamed protein product [Candidula unifasciata]|uniref:Uncharacterized protein n=1 Tax=Candidula unifasciata TaxID=100452 RepID=A0A8S4A2I5_9EUPU|nr:unnamed protein product [Candidula unifasciata]
MASVTLVAGLVSSMFGLFCVVFGLGSSQWFRVRAPYFQNDIGLMRHCDVVTSYCGDMEHLSSIVEADYSAWFRSVQTMYLLHCVGMLVSLVTYILYLVRFLDYKGSFRFLTLLNFLTLAAGIYAVTFFDLNAKKFFGVTSPILPADCSTLGYAFYMAIVGCCFSFLVLFVSAAEAVQAVELLRNMQNRLTIWTTPYTLFVDQEV